MKKVFILFGAEGNLGKGVKSRIIKKDYDRIYLFDRKFKDRTDGKVTYCKIDSLTEESNVEDAFAKIKIDKKSEYFLFSTIGGFAGGRSISETDYSTWQKMLDLNLNVSFLLAKYFVLMASQSAGGSILFTSAMTSFSPATNQAAYGTSKIGLNYLVETLALEGKKQNLTANAFAPFALDNKENRSWVDDVKKLSKPGEIGEFAHYIFTNYKKFNGVIFKLPNTLK